MNWKRLSNIVLFSVEILFSNHNELLCHQPVTSNTGTHYVLWVLFKVSLSTGWPFGVAKVLTYIQTVSLFTPKSGRYWEFRVTRKGFGWQCWPREVKKAWSKFKFRTISANKTVWECCFTWRGFFCWLCSSRLNQQIKFCSCNFEHLKDYFRQRISKIWNMIFRQFLPLRVFYTKVAKQVKHFQCVQMHTNLTPQTPF